MKVHFYKESELQKHLVLLPDGYYSSAKRIPHRGEKAHEKTSCKYPIRRVEVKVDTIPRGNMNYVQDNMFLDSFRKDW